jgi:hypothetical protein
MNCRHSRTLQAASGGCWDATVCVRVCQSHHRLLIITNPACAHPPARVRVRVSPRPAHPPPRVKVRVNPRGADPPARVRVWVNPRPALSPARVRVRVVCMLLEGIKGKTMTALQSQQLQLPEGSKTSSKEAAGAGRQASCQPGASFMRCIGCHSSPARPILKPARSIFLPTVKLLLVLY